MLKRLLWVALLAAAVGATYSNHFQNSFHFDDWHTVAQNPAIRSLDYVPRYFYDVSTFSSMPDHCSYRPLLTASLALDYHLAGGLDNLFWFHFSTLLAFFAQLVLMAELFTILLERSRPSPLNRPLACLVTLWYGVHPVNAETVNYVIQRGDVYSTLGVVAGLFLYVRGSWLYLVPVALGTLVKPSAVMFAPILLVYLWLYDRRRIMRRVAPAFALCVGLYLLQNWFTGQHQFGGTSLYRHLISQPWIAFHYVKSALLPTELSADADWEALRSPWCAEALAGFLFLAGAVGLAARGPRSVAFGIAWFFLALAPTSLVPLAEVTNDHRMYFPYVGLMLAVAGGLRELSLSRRFWVLFGVLLLGYALGTRARNEVWRTEESLWKDVTVKSPRNGRGWMNYGLTQMNAGNLEAALVSYEKALTLVPNYSVLHINLGVLKGRMRKVGAEEHFRRALELDRVNADPPGYYGRWLLEEGRLEEAATQLQEALKRKPGHLASLHALLDVYYRQRNWPALERLLAASQPTDPVVANHARRMQAYRERRFPGGVPLQEALEISYVLFQAGAFEESIRAAEYALTLEPRSALAWNNISVARGGLGDTEGAIAAARQALALQPDFQLARNNLEEALKRKRER